MAQLNFPNTRQDGSPLQANDQYTGDNGVTYIYDGAKWIGHAVAQPAGTNSITNNGHTVQIDSTGNLVIPNNATIVYASGAPVVTSNTSTRWDAGNVEGCPVFASLTTDQFHSYTQKSHLEINGDGSWNIGSNFNSTGLFSNDNTATLYSNLGDVIIRVNDSQTNFTFGQDGYLTMESLQLEGFLKGVDGSTGSTGQVLTRQSNGGVAWADATGGSGGPVFQLTSGTAVVSLNTSGALTLPLGSQLLEQTWSTTVTAITTGTRTFVTFAANEFVYPEQGQITISGVDTPNDVNSTWYYQASDPNQVELHYGEDFASPVDSTAWSAYTSGGTVTLITQLQLNSNGNIWKFMADGSTIVPNGQRVIFGEQNGGAYIQAGMGFHINSTEGISLEAVDLTNPAAPVSHGWYFSPYGTLTVPGGVTLNTENGLVAPEGGYSELADYNLNNFMWVDPNAAYIATNYNNSANIWTFDQDGFLTLPLSTKINSGGIDTTNSVEFGTVVATDPFPPNQGVANITNSEIYMSGGSAEARIITDAATGSLIYTGVEHVEVPAFAGMVAVDPDVTSQYSIDVDPDGRIVIGATQEEGTLTTTDYTVGIGALNSSYTINGLLANPGGTFITGLYGISMNTERGQVLFGGQPEECAPGLVSHFHIMKGNNYTVSTDLFFGDDYNYVKLPGADYIGSPDNPYNPLDDNRNFGVEIATVDLAAVDFQQYIWRFDTKGGLEFPDNSVQTTAWDYRNLENLDMDGGAASTVYTINVRFAEGGAAGTRFSKTDPNYNGANAYGAEPEFTLDGGRA